MIGWVLAALGLVAVVELWRLTRALGRLTAQLAVLTLVVRDVLDRIDEGD